MIRTTVSFGLADFHRPWVVHSRAAKRTDVMRYCSAWATSQAAIVQPREVDTGVASAEPPSSRVIAGTGDGGGVCERARAN